MRLKAFASPAEFRAWLATNYGSVKELLIRCYKSHARDQGLTSPGSGRGHLQRPLHSPETEKLLEWGPWRKSSAPTRERGSFFSEAILVIFSSMHILQSFPRALMVGLLLLAIALMARNASAQTDAPSSRPREAPTARVVVLPVALYNAQANVQEASDSSQAALSTEVLTGKLRELLAKQLIDEKRVDSAATAPAAQAKAGGQPCNVIVACVRQVGKILGAPWAVMAKVSKTSNLIWLFTGQLIHVPSGEIILDDSTELKGETTAMVRAGSRIFAERVARTVRRGGVATNFPTTSPK